MVGPNGSGKSNIVNAIKWVLGEQSVKSLRGHEMTDVIFNGSGSRRAQNAAEITLTFDNSKHLLAVDSPEVGITRRVYRSGEGEYLINRNPARLRDIRDLLSGTGMGTQAYSVIEQGKVDVLLQSSPRDRRMIFEEAAGISRFKQQKLEALRRLERVDQNLLRLADIVDEVESRLRSVRVQAGKARRYKEHTDRLQELRTQVGQVDWKRLTQQLTTFENQRQSLGDERSAASAEAENIEVQLLGVDRGTGELTEEIRQTEAQIAAYRERIAAAESTIEHERRRGADLEREIARYRLQLAAMSARAGDLQQQLRDTADAWQNAEQNHRDVTQHLVDAQRRLTEATASLDQLRGENERCRAAHLQHLRLGASLDNEIGVLESQSAASEAAGRRSAGRLAELDQTLDALQRQLDELQRFREEAAQRLDQQAARLAGDKDQLDQYRRRHTARHDELAELLQRHSGAAERASVLEDLVRRHDGLGAGVKETLQRAANPADPVFRNVCGLVADLFHVGVESAPLVEIALGQIAQHVVAIRSGELLSFLQAESNRLSGRAGFVWLDDEGVRDQESGVRDQESGVRDQKSGGRGQESGGRGQEVGWVEDVGWVERSEPHQKTAQQLPPNPQSPIPNPSPPAPRPSSPIPNLEGRPGVLGRADRFVKTERRFAPLAQRLLCRTWFVEKLSHALLLARSLGQGLSYVTLAGELLEPDGTLTVGPRNISTGLISRRSQLRAIQSQIEELKAAIDAARNDVARLDEQIDAQQLLVDRRGAEHQRTADALAENRVAVSAAEERRMQLRRQRNALERECNEAQQLHDAAVGRLAEAREKRKQCAAALADAESNLALLGEKIQRIEADRAAAERETTEIKVELATSEERLQNLRARAKQFEESQQERDRAIAEAREHLAESAERAEASRWSILKAESETAELYLRKESLAGQTVGLIDRRDALGRQRGVLAAEAQKTGARLHKLEEKIHAAELSANEVRHQQGALADRLREDYGIELAELEHQPTDEEQRQREEVQQEIEELRQKINNLGNVNLEALDELEQLESRHKTLSEQSQDLASAKGSLEKIIDKINADSRRLFSETLEAVKGHFQTLFRDLFGGGRADIVLEENVDLLDSGIEIVARPPGKEPRSISLLSGGEKTLTCVALLLAIFRSRPSPFCVLDEVDAALDEANIDRFTQVLKDFLAWTQFIIVTHSKKTMTCADTIYGVTMQESGVTKQVSVRFEDVSDDGRILTDRSDDRPVQKAA